MQGLRSTNKTKNVDKNMKTQDQTELNKIGSKFENQIKYLGINMRNINCMLFQNNCYDWNEILKTHVRVQESTIVIVGMNVCDCLEWNIIFISDTSFNI